MELIYKKADANDIDALIDLKIKQNIYNCNEDGLVFNNEEKARKNIKKVLLEELNKSIYFYIAIDKSNNRTVASNGVIIHQMVPTTLCLNGKKAYITCVYTDEDYRCKGIQNILMQNILDFLKEIECKKIELDVTNPNAIKLYEKFGFEKDNEKYILNRE
ncbi:MAG: GNAT family N-acetyltransferase [Clostridia bacterium]|nr:GNAT family N-acetyltransferase [Clostridia bacterium]